MEDKFALMKKKLGPQEEDEPSKSIIVNGKIHKQMREHCRFQKKKIGGLTEDLISLYLSNPEEVQKLIDSMKKSGGK
jgi:predicted lactoylglutathione lyase